MLINIENQVQQKLIQGLDLQQPGHVSEAERAFLDVLAMDPSNCAAYYSLSLIYFNCGLHTDAFDLCNKALESCTSFSPIFFLKGSIEQAVGRNDEALASFDHALALKPDYTEVLINSGALLRGLLRHKEALERFNSVLSYDPDNTAALANCAILLTEFKQSEQAIAMFQKLLRIDPNFNFGPGLLLYERLHIADWTDFDQLRNAIRQGVMSGKRVCKSLAFMAISDSSAEHFLCARVFAEQYCPKSTKPLWTGESYKHDRIRLAYVSPDFREHPVGHLMAGVFEHHDKSRFETIAISLGADDQSRLRARMLRAFDHFVDARGMGARQVAEKMRELEVDIAIDLAGYTSDSRIEIFSYRPAPVQVNFLGYPGTLGVGFMDYILADRHVIPPEHHPFYMEQVAYLPDCYLPVASGLEISQVTPSRAECGLPEEGAVFCSFSHSYKISPPLWAVWMRLLQQVPNSVLWLTGTGAVREANLRQAAVSHGISPERICFAGRVPRVEDHLARYRLADVFLDTWPYNAHTTAADALLSGLPVVTYMGDAFPARVAGSLLYAAGLPELIGYSWEEYEALAIRMITDDAWRAGIRAKLGMGENVGVKFFDVSKYTRDLEGVLCQLAVK